MRITNEWQEITDFVTGQGVSNNGDYNILINTSATDTNATLLQPKELVTWNEAVLFAKTKQQQSVSDLSVGSFSNFVNVRGGIVPSISLEDLPATDPTMAWSADHRNCTFNAKNEIIELRDLTGNYNLTPLTPAGSPQVYVPVLTVDNNDRAKIDIPLNGGFRSPAVLGSDLLGANGNTMSFLFVLDPEVIDGQMQIAWGDNTTEDTFRTLLMRNDAGRCVVDTGTFPNARWERSSTDMTADTINSVYFERNGNTTELWINGVSQGTDSGSATIPTNVYRPLNIGYRLGPDFKSEFKFRFMAIYNRVLTDQERNSMFAFSRRYYGV